MLVGIITKRIITILTTIRIVVVTILWVRKCIVGI